MWARCKAAGLAAALLLIGGPAWGEVVTVPVQELGPTQQEVGKAQVADMVASFLRGAERGMERAFVRRRLKPRFERETFVGIIDPAGVVRLLDGHHRAATLSEIRKAHGVDFNLKVQIEQDYRGWSLSRYARDLTRRRGKGHFARGTRLLPSASLRVSRLPRRISQCKDSPLRSAVGMAMFRMGIDSRLFDDYIEFALAGRLRRDPTFRSGKARLRGREGSPEITARIARRITRGSCDRLLLRRIRPGREVAARAALARSKAGLP